MHLHLKFNQLSEQQCTPEQADMFIDRLPIIKFFGIGKVTEKKMHEIGIKTGADLKRRDREELLRLFGKAGGYFYDIAHGKDTRPVNAHRRRKSIGKETTLSMDIDDKVRMLDILEKIALNLEKSLKELNLRSKTVTLKIKYFDFQSITRNVSVLEPVENACEMMKLITLLLDRTEAGRKKVRLLGISLTNFADSTCVINGCVQLKLPFIR